MASTTVDTKSKEIENIPTDIKAGNKKQDLTRQNHQTNRRTLQTIQYSTGGPVSPIRKIVKPQKKNLIQKNQKPITIFCDPPQKRLDDKASQTEKGQNGGNSEAYDMLVSEEVSETYWRDLAEERRKALDESLHENEQLHKEVTDLKEENEKLSKVAGQAEYFANVLKEVLGAEEEEEEENKEVLNSTDNDENSDKTENQEDNEKLGTNQLLLDNDNDKQELNPEEDSTPSENIKKLAEDTSVKGEDEDKITSEKSESGTSVEKNLSQNS